MTKKGIQATSPGYVIRAYDTICIVAIVRGSQFIGIERKNIFINYYLINNLTVVYRSGYIFFPV